MRSSAILISAALTAATFAAALPVSEDGLVARYEAQSELTWAAFVLSVDDVSNP